MEASKCPKCGDEPFFIEHIEKWYCYGCNSYIESEEDHHVHCETKDHVDAPEAASDAIVSELHALELESKPVCKNCGAVIESIRDGKLYCNICEASPVDDACSGNSELGHNDAQSLLDSAVCGPVIKESVSKPEKRTLKAEPAKPAPAPAAVSAKPIEAKTPEKAPEIKMCATCGQPLKFIDKYSRHYCYACRKYAPKDEPVRPKVVPVKSEPGPKSCPGCSGELKYIEKYSEYYCYTCKKYPLRAQKAVQDKPAPVKTGPLECTKCGQPVKLIEKYSRYYCYSCKEYAPKGFGGLSGQPQEKKFCPTCKDEMKFISEYNEWYCYKCRKYALRPSKPVLLV